MDTAAGIDVGGTKILAGLVDTQRPESGLLAARRMPTPRDGAALVDELATLVRELEAEGRRRGAPVGAVGLGTAGLVDRDGRLGSGPNLPGVVDVPLRDDLERRLDRRISVENDATMATWGELRAGAGRGCSDLIAVTLGTGIGGGIVAGGVLVVGSRGFAGEFGHMVVDPDGPPCPCGRRGCWERYASGRGLTRLARDAAESGRLAAVVQAVGGDVEAVRGHDLDDAARAGDPEALAVYRQFAWWVALGLANLANVLDPEVVVLGGGLVRAIDLFLDDTRAAFDELLYESSRRPTPIEPAALGEEASAIGAALLAAEGGLVG